MHELGAGDAEVHRVASGGDLRDSGDHPRRPRNGEFARRRRTDAGRCAARAHRRAYREAVMPEWWTYSLSDFLMFSSRTYYRQFELLNAQVWPAQVVAIALGLAIAALWWRKLYAGRSAAIVLAVMWLCVGWTYLLDHYDDINWTGKYFAAGFALQALLLFLAAARNRVFLRRPNDSFGLAGMAVFALAVIGY